MAFTPNDLQCVIPRVGTGDGTDANAGRGMAIFTYRTDDTNAAVVTADYIDGVASDYGIKDGDMCLAVVDEDGTIQGRIYYFVVDETNDDADFVEITAT